MDINIDIGTASLAENTRWKGFGFISANGSSRLLLDYKYEQPESYNETPDCSMPSMLSEVTIHRGRMTIRESCKGNTVRRYGLRTVGQCLE